MSRSKQTLEGAFLQVLEYGYDPDLVGAFAIKNNWKRVSKSYFQYLVSLTKPELSNVWFSAGGPLVMGDIHLQMMKNGKGFHLFTYENCFNGSAVIRTISHIGDYSGGFNQWLRFEDLKQASLLKRFEKMFNGEEV